MAEASTTILVEEPRDGLFVGDGSRFGREAIAGHRSLGRFD